MYSPSPVGERSFSKLTIRVVARGLKGPISDIGSRLRLKQQQQIVHVI